MMDRVSEHAMALAGIDSEKHKMQHRIAALESIVDGKTKANVELMNERDRLRQWQRDAVRLLQEIAERDAEIAELKEIVGEHDVINHSIIQEQAAEIEKLRQWQRDAVRLLQAAPLVRAYATGYSHDSTWKNDRDKLLSEVEGDG